MDTHAFVREVRAGVAVVTCLPLTRRGIPHGFSTRVGGTSRGAYASLNLGPRDDDADAVAENWGRLEQACAVDGRTRYAAAQVHGKAVHDPDAGGPSAEADAVIARHAGSYAAVRIADCCPVLLADAAGRTVAAVHAGWRGCVGGVVEAAVNAMSVDPRDLIAAIGPCIGPDAFEVGPEVADVFVGRFGPEVVRRRAGKADVDLAGSVRRVLVDAGLPEPGVFTCGLCTHRRAEDFFSHRRDRGVTGRMAAVIGPAGG